MFNDPHSGGFTEIPSMQQIIVNRVIPAMRKQGEAAGFRNRDGTISPCYHDRDGRKCPVGHLITADAFERNLLEFESDGHSPSLRDRRVRQALEESGVPCSRATMSLLSALQDAHDHAVVFHPDAFLETFETRVRKEILDLGLKFPGY